MNNSGSERMIEIKKADLIDKIKTNRDRHIEDYNNAVIAYKEEALKQIKQITKDVKAGSLKVSLKLTSPEAGDRLWCKNVPITELVQSCKEECAKNLPGQDKLEAGGCDGYTSWCWCNSTEGTINPNNTDSHIP